MPRSKRDRPIVRRATIGITDALDLATDTLPELWYGDPDRRSWVHRLVFDEAMYALCDYVRAADGDFPQPLRFAVASGPRRAAHAERELALGEALLSGDSSCIPASIEGEGVAHLLAEHATPYRRDDLPRVAGQLLEICMKHMTPEQIRSVTAEWRTVSRPLDRLMEEDSGEQWKGGA